MRNAVLVKVEGSIDSQAAAARTAMVKVVRRAILIGEEEDKESKLNILNTFRKGASAVDVIYVSKIFDASCKQTQVRAGAHAHGSHSQNRLGARPDASLPLRLMPVLSLTPLL